MSEKTAQTLQEIPSARTPAQSRILPFAVAVIVCSAIAFRVWVTEVGIFSARTTKSDRNINRR